MTIESKHSKEPETATTLTPQMDTPQNSSNNSDIDSSKEQGRSHVSKTKTRSTRRYNSAMKIIPLFHLYVMAIPGNPLSLEIHTLHVMNRPKKRTPHRVKIVSHLTPMYHVMR